MSKRRTLTVFFVFLFTIIMQANAQENTISNKSETELQNTTTIEVTYIANEGVMISSGTKKILIDALFPKVNTTYEAPPADVLEKMETAQAPFDKIDLILATHNHGDHFEANSVARCLQNNPETVFISTPQAVENIKNNFKNFAEIKHQVKTEKLEPQQSIEKTVNGINVKIIRTIHSGGNQTTQNQMYLLSIGGKKVFHEGDSGGQLETFENLGLEKEGIDVALIHFWFLLVPHGREIVNKYLKPKNIVLIHTPIDRVEVLINDIEKLKNDFPDVTIFKNPMEKKLFK